MNSMFTRRLFALALLLTAPACSQQSTNSTVKATETPSPNVAQIDQGPQLTSSVPGLMLTRTHTLPLAPASAADRGGCGHLLSKSTSPAARAVAKRGWAVTGQATVGGYRAVSFIGKMGQGTSGSCLLEQGNVGFFLGNKLVALAWMKPDAKRSIARIEQRGEQDARLWDGDFLSQPFADIRAGDEGAISAGPMAKLDRVCEGTAQVPNIYGIPIVKARNLLAQQGWKPVTHSRRESEIGYAIADLVQRGITEVDDCSGTGFGFCRLDYASNAGTLGVTTVGDGDWPVADYTVQCRTNAKAT
jgi:hypothetical protein